MKWLVRFFFAVTVLVAAALVGGLFLPSRAHVERSVSIDRPPATVYTLLSSTRTFHEWSPWAQREPDAIFGFDGPSFGAGSKYVWSGEIIGAGELVLTEAQPYTRVEGVVDLGPRGRARMTFAVEPKPGGSRVTWSYDADFGLDIIGRYAGRFFDGATGPVFDDGLPRFKALAESLPGADFSDADAEIVDTAAMQVVSVAGQVRAGAAEQQAAFDAAAAQVRAFMRANGLRQSGPLIARTVRWEPPLWVFEAAAPYAGEAREGGEGDVAFTTLPAARAVRAVHRGPASGVAPLTTKLEAYLAAHRLRRAGPSWEVRVTERDGVADADQITEIYIPVE